MLCEKRLLEVAPDHPLPVQLGHLGGKQGIAGSPQTPGGTLMQQQITEMKKLMAIKEQVIYIYIYLYIIFNRICILLRREMKNYKLN